MELYRLRFGTRGYFGESLPGFKRATTCIGTKGPWRVFGDTSRWRTLKFTSAWGWPYVACQWGCRDYFRRATNKDPRKVRDFIKRRWTKAGALRIQAAASIMPGPYTHPGYQAGMRLAR